MNKYKLRILGQTLASDIFILDDNDNLKFTISPYSRLKSLLNEGFGSLLFLGTSYKIMNTKNEEVCILNQKLSTIFPKFNIVINNQIKGFIRCRNKSITVELNDKIYCATQNGWNLVHDLEDKEKNYLGKIHRTSNYDRILIYPENNEDLFLFVIFSMAIVKMFG